MLLMTSNVGEVKLVSGSRDVDRDHADFTPRNGVAFYYLTAACDESQRSVRNHEGAGGGVVSFASNVCSCMTRRDRRSQSERAVPQFHQGDTV